MNTTYSTPTDTTLVCTRAFPGSAENVFDAWTQSGHLTKWMLGPEGWTMPVCEVDLRPGGKWRHVWRREDGTEMSMHGTYREIARPTRLVSTESWGAGWPETVNTLELTETDGGTRITLTITYPSKEARDAAAKTGMREGMNLSFERLEEHLKTLGSSSRATNKMIFVNLPVRDLKASMTFYKSLGYQFNQQFTDETAACMVISDTIFAMLLTHAKFKEFAPNPIVDAHKSTEVLNCLACDSREHVDDLVRKAVAAGGRTYSPAKDYGFMYSHGFQDIDGHVWELMWMDPKNVQQGECELESMQV